MSSTLPGISPPSPDNPQQPLKIGMLSAASGKRGRSSEGRDGVDRASGSGTGGAPAQADAEADEWDEIIQNLSDGEEQGEAKRPRHDEPREDAEDRRDHEEAADPVDDIHLEGTHGEVKPDAVRVPVQPTKEEVEEHNLTHLPFRNWCPICVAARAREDAHRTAADLHRRDGHPTIGIDYKELKIIRERWTYPREGATHGCLPKLSRRLGSGTHMFML